MLTKYLANDFHCETKPKPNQTCQQKEISQISLSFRILNLIRLLSNSRNTTCSKLMCDVKSIMNY